MARRAVSSVNLEVGQCVYIYGSSFPARITNLREPDDPRIQELGGRVVEAKFYSLDAGKLKNTTLVVYPDFIIDEELDERVIESWGI